MTTFSKDESQALNEIAGGMASYGFGQYWPAEYNELFRLWGYFNRIYDTLYLDQHEWQRIARFALDVRFKAIWDELEGMEEAKELARQPCVGNGRKEFAPSERIRGAFGTLRSVYQIDVKKVCESKKCLKREENGWDVCLKDKPNQSVQNTKVIDEANRTSLGATLLIIYQVRCNLFHGSKIEISGEEFERNHLLVRLSAAIMMKLLELVVALSPKPTQQV
jgi:hypothetical protein